VIASSVHFRAKSARKSTEALIMARIGSGIVHETLTVIAGSGTEGAAFVGVFVARIFRGRSIREFVVGVLVVPSLVFFAWFTAFGGTDHADG
jgi:BCCT, betaine/carnitine/choline family transporter